MKLGKWDVRIRRAGELAKTHSFAAEGLLFYDRLARFQKSFYLEVEGACGPSKVSRSPGALRSEFDPFLLLPRFAPFLSLIEEVAPPPLAQSARELWCTKRCSDLFENCSGLGKVFAQSID